MTDNLLLGIGECMVELALVEPGLYRQSFAGDVFNTLWHAQRAFDARPGWRAGFLSAVGDDPVSDAMLEFFDASGVDRQDVRRIAGARPGLYMIHLDGAERSFSYWRDTSAARRLAEDAEALEAGLARAQAVYFSGITLAILPDADRARLIAALGRAKAAGARVVFDPNHRAALWRGRDAGAAALAAAAAADLVLPGLEDHAALFGAVSGSEAAERYLQAGAGLVVVKDGPGLVICSGPRIDLEIETVPVADPVDTTGAGDSFNGGFLAAWLGGAEVADAVRAGQAAAAHVIRHHGALVSREGA